MYYIVKSILYCWSLLPMPLLYLQSDLLRFLVYRIFGYRKKVVRANLELAFPEATPQERKAIEKIFYKNFCDTLVEIIKLMSISSANIRKRLPLGNPEILTEMVAHGQGGVAIFGHYCNWEWLAAGLSSQLPFPTAGVYQPLNSKLFDRLMLHIRTRFGNEMITMQSTYRECLKRLRSPGYVGFLADQTPSRHGKLYFSPFFGQPAPIHLGPATISLKMNVPMYFFDIRRITRGQYEIVFAKIPHEDLLPFSKKNVHELTDRHVAYLEQMIRRDPGRWLWSHRRWKHKVSEADSCSPKI